jgi:hypothetical protein
LIVAMPAAPSMAYADIESKVCLFVDRWKSNSSPWQKSV